MSFLPALTRWELKLALRSVRFKVAVVLYLALCAVPPVMLFLLNRAYSYGSATFLSHLMDVQPFLTILLTVLVAGHRSGSASWPEMWPVLASSPLGNAGYLLGRWLAMNAILLPVSLVPVAATALLAGAAGSPWHDAGSWLGSWALRIVPMVVVTSAMWLGMVTILGSELAAAGATFVGVQLVLAIVNKVLFRFHILVELSLTLGSFSDFRTYLGGLEMMTSRYREEWASRFAASEAPLDAVSVAGWVLPRLLVGAAVACMVLALAVAYVRRTRRDLKPRPVPKDHQLRTYLEALLRLREHLTPAAALGRRDYFVMVCGLLVLAGGCAFNLDQQKRFQGLALERYETETGDPFAPSAAEIRSRFWKVRSSFDAWGNVESHVRTTLEHTGREPQAHMSFSLNENLDVAEVEAEGHSFTTERAWDRLRLTIEPPLEPGETLEIGWRLTGTPARIHFPLWGPGSESFVKRYGRFRTARFPRGLSDLSLSRAHRAVSTRRVQLEATDLAPVPRYTPWALVDVDPRDGELREVPEDVLQAVDLEVEVTIGDAVFLADACGHWSRAGAGRSTLAGNCRVALSDYTVYGGPFKILDYGEVVFAALEPHLGRAQQYAESLVTAARLGAKAWPGRQRGAPLARHSLDGQVIAEWVPLFKRRENLAWQWSPGGEHYVRGELLLVSERSLSRGYLPNSEYLVAELMTRDLVARRDMETSQELLFRKMIQALMMQRMGASRQDDAVIVIDQEAATLQFKPPLEAGPYSWLVWRRVLPAVLFDLAGRVGSATLFEALEEFLAIPSPESGTLKSFFNLLEQVSGVSLERFYGDFIADSAMPELVFEDVTARAERNGFRVTGHVRNDGTGQVFCPVNVKTEVAVVKTLVTIDSQSSSRFEVRVPTKPFAVELDPEGTCLRKVGRMRHGAEYVDLSG